MNHTCCAVLIDLHSAVLFYLHSPHEVQQKKCACETLGQHGDGFALNGEDPGVHFAVHPCGEHMLILCYHDLIRRT